MEQLSVLSNQAVDLLSSLIAMPSFSKEENGTADLLQEFLKGRGIEVFRSGNNVWVRNKYFSPDKPTILLNSHHDTVKPNSGYTIHPFEPIIKDDKLFGLGSNDAGGALVSLASAFIYFYEAATLPFNLIFAGTAEEEISGKGGVESILPELGKIELAIVGEPTLMKAAIAERGLLVVDGKATGKAGHAARKEGVNAIYLAMKDIDWFRSYQFEKTSEWLGDTTMQVTVINAGTAHNQVPAECNFTVDIRLNEHYTHEQILEIISQNVLSVIKPRSTRIRPSFIDTNHPFVQLLKSQNVGLYGSPTTSDMALMPFPSVKMGPGDSARSHSADEFIYLSEIEEAITQYIAILNQYAPL